MALQDCGFNKSAFSSGSRDFGTTFCAGVGNNSVVLRSQRSWACSHCWAANPGPHSVLSRSPTGYTASTWQRVGFWCSRKPLCMIPWLEIYNKGPESCGSTSGCCLPGPERKSWSLGGDSIPSLRHCSHLGLLSALPQGRCAWAWPLLAPGAHCSFLSNMGKNCHCKWQQLSTKPFIKKWHQDINQVDKFYKTDLCKPQRSGWKSLCILNNPHKEQCRYCRHFNSVGTNDLCWDLDDNKKSLSVLSIWP